MKFVFISDTHLQAHGMDLPDGDVLVHCGDALGRGTPGELIKFAAWFNKQPHRHKIFVPGNHDGIFETDYNYAKSFLNAHILIDQKLEIEGIQIYGTPWTPIFLNWFFMAQPDQLQDHFSRIPLDLDLLITHGPPKGILDTIEFGRDHLGSEELYQHVIRAAPKYHVFGHIHGGYGMFTSGETTFINASTCTEAYKPRNAPVVLDLYPWKFT